MNINKTLRKIDLRMCSIHSELHQKINDKLREAFRSDVFNFVEDEILGIEFRDECIKCFEDRFEN